MTNVKFYKKNGCITKIFASGHAFFGDFGTDIVCAGLSSLLGSAHLGLLQVAKVKLKHSQNEKSGTFDLEIYQNNEKSDAILQTTLLSIAELAKYYSKNIKLEIIGE